MLFKCSQCRNRFVTSECLRAHQSATRHCYCEGCKIFFRSHFQHIQHVRRVPHDEENQCCDCKRKYVNHEALTTHCCDCDRVFCDEEALIQHVESDVKHSRKSQSVQPYLTGRYKCTDCRKTFDKQLALKMHTGAKHKPPRNLRCPVGTKCKRFASASALLGHLESGMCTSGLSREKLNQFIIQHDHERHITSTNAMTFQRLQTPELFLLDQATSLWESEMDVNPRPMLTPTSGSVHESQIQHYASSIAESDDTDDESDGGVLLTPSSGNTFSMVSSMRSPQFTPNDSVLDLSDTEGGLVSLHLSRPSRLRCHLCPPQKQAFISVRSLQMHLESPAHAPKIFKCPMKFAVGPVNQGRPKPEKHFSTLSGLASHLEAGACQGGLETFRNAFEYVEARLKLLGLGEIKLLSEPKKCC